MLKNLDVQGFRCFRSLQVPIRPLTVLIGRNDTGKSAFLSALRFLVDGGGFQRQDVWRDDQRMRISMSVFPPADLGVVVDDPEAIDQMAARRRSLLPP